MKMKNSFFDDTKNIKYKRYFNLYTPISMKGGGG